MAYYHSQISRLNFPITYQMCIRFPVYLTNNNCLLVSIWKIKYSPYLTETTNVLIPIPLLVQ